ncbi:MAG TPA: hypothetical protein VLF79_03880 [Candidatus Saccharimonadales bacterium]|nr:hypothetical protein [Candidatus Saccharimonadales bacterium]
MPDREPVSRNIRLGQTETSFYVEVQPRFEDDTTMDSPRQGIIALR